MPDNHWEPVNVDVPFTSTVNIDLWEKMMRIRTTTLEHGLRAMKN
jgi:hypothetical protein